MKLFTLLCPALRTGLICSGLGATLVSQSQAQTTEAGTLQNPAAPADTAIAKIPFVGMDVTWVNGLNRQTNFPLILQDKDGETVLTGSAIVDGYFNYNFARPLDHTQTISGEISRAQEFSLALATIGVESNYKNIIGRVWLQTGSMLSVINEVDGSVLRGRNAGPNLGPNRGGIGVTTSNLKYIREAAAGYHFNVAYGLNVEMGIFIGFLALESYVPQENWNYQCSFVCDITPALTQGLRVQLYPTKNFKTELWIVNGWHSYHMFNRQPGLGSSNTYRPNENAHLVANVYYGNESRPDTISAASASLRNGRPGSGRNAYPNVVRFHHDNSVVIRYYHKNKSGPLRGITQAAFSLNTHYGFQSGTDAASNSVKARDNYVFGSTLANRLWFAKNRLALATRVGFITNPSRYLAYNPSVVGFTDTNISKLTAKEFTTTFDIMPKDFVTFRFEYLHRRANVPYFAGRRGTTSPTGYSDQTVPDDYVPDLRKTEDRLLFSINFRL